MHPSVGLKISFTDGGIDSNVNCTTASTFNTSNIGGFTQGASSDSYAWANNLVDVAITQNASYLLVGAFPNTGTAKNGFIWVRKIQIIKTPPFNVTPVNIPLTCGSTTPVTFTVNNIGGITGITNYTWDLGPAANGWVYNGSPAAQSISTSINNTLTLTPVCGNIQNNVSATVIANSSNYNTNTSTVSILQPTMSINGNSLICASSSTYSITGLPCNATVAWSASPTGVITPNTSASLNPSFSRVSDGLVTLTATISNNCGSQSTTRIKEVIVGMPNASLTGSYNYTGGGSIPIANFGNPVTLFGKNNAAYAVNIGLNSLYTGINSFVWSVAGGNGYNNVSFNGGAAYFNLQGTGAPTISLNVTVSNFNCGSITRNIVVIANQAGRGSITVTPNPAADNINMAFTEASDFTSTQKSGGQTLTAIRSFNSTGKTIISLFELNTSSLARQWTKNEINNKTYNFNLSGLRKGVYMLQVDRNNQATTTKIIIE